MVGVARIELATPAMSMQTGDNTPEPFASIFREKQPLLSLRSMTFVAC